jgi:DinB superfamily
MSDLHTTIAAVLSRRYLANARRIRELATPLSENQFWQKPFPFGNSFGHLVLHLTGNLNYYIGAQIAGTDYVRDREREFADLKPPAKEDTLKRLEDAAEMVVETIRGQSPEDWSAAYQGTGSEAKNRLEMVLQCQPHATSHRADDLSHFSTKPELRFDGADRAGNR